MRTVQEIEKDLGVAPITGDDFTQRKLLNEWLAVKGIPLHRVRGMQMKTMQKCYNHPRYLTAVTRKFVRDARDQMSDTQQQAPAEVIDWDRVKAMIEERARAIVVEYAAPRPPVEVIVRSDTGKLLARAGQQHKQFPELLKACTARTSSGQRLNIMMVGPAGSGKTTAGENIAKVMKLPFYFNGSVDTEYKLLGFTDAHGKTVRRPFREAFSKPSVYLFDEIDGSHPNGVLPLNSALANGAVDFPDAIERRHKDCIILAAANTFGLGGTSDYVGRNKLDAAFIDRFVMLDWQIDEDLERATCSDEGWCEYVQTVRRRCKDKGMRVIISPRASYYGAALLQAGLERNVVAAMTLRKGMSLDQWEAVNV
jgi:dynein-related subfamily AAA family protein